MSALAIIEAMEAAGCDAETIIRAIKHSEEAKKAERRTYEREKKRRQRAENKQPVPRDNGDNGDTPSSPPEKGPTPQKTNPPSTLQKTPLKGVKKGSRLPSDWELPDDWLEEATSRGFTVAEARDEGERMRDWSLSAPASKGVKRDWRAAWRNWIKRKADERANDKPQHRAANRGAAASQQRKSAWLSALDELDGSRAGPGGPERPQSNDRGDDGPALITQPRYG